MAADSSPQSDARPPGRDRPARPALGGDLLRAFETYFADEQANLEALRHAAERQPEFAPFFQEMQAVQRRKLALLSFEVASMLPDHARRGHGAGTLPRSVDRLAGAITPILATPRRAGVFAGGLAAVVLGALLLFAPRESSLAPATAIAPRVAEAAAVTATATPTVATPTPAPTPQPGVLERARIVAIYGHPYEPITGILGKHPPEEAARVAARLAREAEATDGRPTVGALHITVHVAQAQQTVDGTYLERLGPRGTQPWVDAAREHGLLLIVDTQIGWSDALTETKALEPLLRLPFVHLALDPEFATKSQQLAPGKAIGTLDAAAINDVQAYLGGLVRREGLPRKMLMLHQFRGDMIGHPERIVPDEDIEIVLDMDGYGPPGSKLDAYDQFALAPWVERPGIKLFYEWDEPILLQSELSALARPPDLIVYQ
ncbi:MAG: hypothetical protein AB7G21_08610 [Dehalococcoidia bacterium]